MAGTFLGFTSIPFEPSEIGDPGKKGLSSFFAAEVSFFFHEIVARQKVSRSK